MSGHSAISNVDGNGDTGQPGYAMHGQFHNLGRRTKQAPGLTPFASRRSYAVGDGVVDVEKPFHSQFHESAARRRSLASDLVELIDRLRSPIPNAPMWFRRRKYTVRIVIGSGHW